MAGSQKTCHAIERWTEVIAIALVGGTGMHRYAHAQDVNLPPRFVGEGMLNGNRSFECVNGDWKGNAEGITDGLEDVATVRLDGLAKDGIVTSEGSHHRPGILIPPLSAALDISEEERDRPRGKCRQGHLLRPGNRPVRYHNRPPGLSAGIIIAYWRRLHRSGRRERDRDGSISRRHGSPAGRESPGGPSTARSWPLNRTAMLGY